MSLDSLTPFFKFVVPIYIFVSTAESFIDWLRNKKRNYLEVFSNIFIMLLLVLVRSFLWVNVAYDILLWAYQFAPIKVPDSYFSFAIIFILVDLLFYFRHRLDHRLKFLWLFHSIHHSSTEFNFSTGLRVSIATAYYTWLFFIPVSLLGFSPNLIFFAYGISKFYQFFLHCYWVPKIPFIEGVLNTPSHHRVHHSCAQQHIDKNLGGVFIIWDKIWGTYVEEPANLEYGTTPRLLSINPIKIYLNGYKEFIKSK